MRMKAFPTLKDNGHITTQDGMDLRDYFAAAALHGLLSNPKLAEEIAKIGRSWIVDSSYAWADAMMEARKDD